MAEEEHALVALARPWAASPNPIRKERSILNEAGDLWQGEKSNRHSLKAKGESVAEAPV